MSDGEGDEEEGQRRRIEAEAEEDRKERQKIVKTLAEGFGSRSGGAQGARRGHYGIEELTKGDIGSQYIEDDGKNKNETEEIDYENDEALGEYLTKRIKERDEASKNNTQVDSDDDSNDEDEEENSNYHGLDVNEEDRKITSEKEKMMKHSFFEKTRIKAALLENRKKIDSSSPRYDSVLNVLKGDNKGLVRSQSIHNIHGNNAPKLVRQLSSAILDDLASLGSMDNIPAPPRLQKAPSIVKRITIEVPSTEIIEPVSVDKRELNMPSTVAPETSKIVANAVFGVPIFNAPTNELHYPPVVKKVWTY